MNKPPKQLGLARGDFAPLWESRVPVQLLRASYVKSPGLAGSQTFLGSRAICAILCHVPFEVCGTLKVQKTLTN